MGEGLDLTDARRAELARAVAAAGILALHDSIAKDLGTIEVNGLNLRGWELIGRVLRPGRRTA